MAKSLRIWALALVATLIATILVAMPHLERDADAANAADFDAGYIISDENFYNGRAMTSASQVQSFLQSRNPGCRSGSTCILNYTEVTPTMAASRYCDRIEGRSNETAASIIQRVGQACNISQQALIVLIEKEQSLVTAPAPTDRQFTAATGYGCPDTAPCDAGFGGFFTQMYYGARAYQYYKEHPTQFRHQPNAWNSVLYNPKSSCGSSQVFIRNNATAGLYNYTPYQPNRAALNNLYGTGDTCSSYGNRNFWRLYTDWFGDPTGSSLRAGSAVQSTSTGHYFLYSPQQGFVRVPERQHMRSLGMLASVRQMTPSDIRSYGIASVQITGWGINCGSANYIASQAKIQHFESASTRNHYGMTFTSLPSDLCSALPKGDPKVTQVAKDLDGGLWLIENGKKRSTTTAALNAAGLASEHRITLPRNFANAMPTGDPFTVQDAMVGRVVQSTSTGDYFIFSAQEGMVRVPDRQHLVSMGLNTNVQPMTPTEIRNYGIASTRVTGWGLKCGSANYFASSRSLQHFESASTRDHYGMSFTALPADICNTLTFASSKVTQVAKDLDGGLWVIQNGQMRPATTASLNAAGLDSAYQITLPRGFAAQMEVGRPHVGNEAAVGDVVQSTSTGHYFIYSAQEGMIRVPERRHLVSMGMADNVQQMAPKDITAHGLASTRVTGWGLRCGSVDYFASTRQLQPFESAGVKNHYGLSFTALPSDICEVLSMSGSQVSQVAKDQRGNLWIIQNGTKRPVTEQTLRNAQLASKFRVTLPMAFVDALPQGSEYRVSVLATLESGRAIIGDSDDRYIYSTDVGLIPVEEEGVLPSLGLHESPATLTTEEIEEVGVEDTVLDSWLIQCGTDVFFASKQLLHPVDEELLEHFDTEPVTLPEDVCGLLEVSEISATQVMQDLGGGLWVIEDGERRVATEGTLADADLDDLERLIIPTGFLRSLSIGPDFGFDPETEEMEIPPSP